MAWKLTDQLTVYLVLTLFLDLLITISCASSQPAWKKLLNMTLSNDQRSLLARSGSAVWLDPSTEVAWMFGGQGILNSELTTLDDLWKFDLSSQRWTEVQSDSSELPVGRHHAVACGKGDSIILAGGVDRNGIVRGEVWRYNIVNKSWKLETGYISTLGNITRFWCFNSEVFGLDQNHGPTPILWQYNWDDHVWAKVASDNLAGSASVRISPDLRNVSLYPLWSSDKGFVITYAPVKDERLKITHKPQQRLCILWILDKTITWKPLLNDCEFRKSCPASLWMENVTSNIIGRMPSCRTHTAAWSDSDQNLWLYGGLSTGAVLHDAWKFNTKTRLWHEIKLAPDQSQESPGRIMDAASWRWNDTLYLYGGQHCPDPSNSTFRHDLWTMDLSTLEQSSLPVTPLGIFLIILSGTMILSLVSCGLIILAKCSSPLAPRIRPPVRTYGKVHYSPVSSDDVP